MRVMSGGGSPLLRFDRGERFPAALEAWCASEGIRGAAILCGVGMMDEVELGVYDGTRYERRTFADPMEVVSLQGNVAMRDGAPFAHVHAALGDHDLGMRGGHLFGGRVAMTLEVCLLMTAPLERPPAGGEFRPLDGPTDAIAET
jgi:hypothetical protein